MSFIKKQPQSMSSTYNTKENSAPTSLLVNARFFFISSEIKLFDCLIKTKIPTPRCLLQVIYVGSSLSIINRS